MTRKPDPRLTMIQRAYTLGERAAKAGDPASVCTYRDPLARDAWIQGHARVTAARAHRAAA